MLQGVIERGKDNQRWYSQLASKAEAFGEHRIAGLLQSLASSTVIQAEILKELEIEIGRLDQAHPFLAFMD